MYNFNLKLLTLVLLIWLPLQGVADGSLIHSQTTTDACTAASSVGMADHDCCNETQPEPKSRCEHCPDCSLTLSAGTIEVFFSNQIPTSSGASPAGATSVLHSRFIDPVLKPPRNT